mmetsp:Transcript_21950/g.55901  ORF Transcript_21950/g.55901 Transcript_21950/m.55901 type:complete len:322 (-) Transcript_21950:189-1154(-)
MRRREGRVDVFRLLLQLPPLLLDLALLLPALRRGRAAIAAGLRHTLPAVLHEGHDDVLSSVDQLAELLGLLQGAEDEGPHDVRRRLDEEGRLRHARQRAHGRLRCADGLEQVRLREVHLLLRQLPVLLLAAELRCVASHGLHLDLAHHEGVLHLLLAGVVQLPQGHHGVLPVPLDEQRRLLRLLIAPLLVVHAQRVDGPDGALHIVMDAGDLRVLQALRGRVTHEGRELRVRVHLGLEELHRALCQLVVEVEKEGRGGAGRAVDDWLNLLLGNVDALFPGELKDLLPVIHLRGQPGAVLKGLHAHVLRVVPRQDLGHEEAI